MNTICKTTGLLAMLCAIFFITSCGGGKKKPAETKTKHTVETKKTNTIVDAAMSDTNFTILVELLKTAKLVDMLADTTATYTVFAPNNAAFRSLGREKIDALKKDIEKLKTILAYHVVEGKFDAVSVQNSDNLETASGKQLPITTSDGIVKAGNGTIITTDIMTDNGIIHVVDAVLMPENNTGSKKSAKSKQTPSKGEDLKVSKKRATGNLGIMKGKQTESTGKKSENKKAAGSF